MKKSSFIDAQEFKKLEENHKKVRASMSPEQLKVAQEADAAFEEITQDVFDFESENRVRRAGYSPQEAEDIAFILKKENIQVGQVFKYHRARGVELLTLTPFKTVVPAQTYITSLQDRLFEITTVDQEVMVSNLKSQVQQFTSLSFFGLIKLAFKRLIKGRNNGK